MSFSYFQVYWGDTRPTTPKFSGLKTSGMSPEPTNPVDAHAIAFECKLNDKWQKIGYVVREALDAVHDALQRSG